MRSTRISTVVFLMLITAALVSTQDPPVPQGTPARPTFRTGVNVVRVDVIVTDNSGTPVTNLTQDEFEIVEDGRPQTIDLFRTIHIDVPRRAPIGYMTGTRSRHRRTRGQPRRCSDFCDPFGRLSGLRPAIASRS